ncbi:glycosyl transferase [Oleiharenicola lentus]|uniref:glycosyl transferase n=1 Tax=Oleiharenicola lentus TaxID=2508720 RepID=UPI003F671863
MSGKPSTPTFAQRLGLGRLALALWHQPVSKIRDSLRNGGPWQEKITERGRHEMELAARSLPPVHYAGPTLEVHLLTGKRFWYQTAFCLWTFSRHSQRALAPVIYDDGTLTEEFRAPLIRLFPQIRFVAQADTIARLDHFLPAEKFPTLRERWVNYPNIRKLTDPHVGSHGWKLVLDSDLLFFHRPEFLLRWLEAPARPLHAVDCETSYGYSRGLMDQLSGGHVDDLINVGLTGLNSDELDWERLEHWCHTLIQREGTSYYLEQAIIAMLVTGRECAIAPAKEYLTLPLPPETHHCHAVMHHYVAHSKRWYFQQNWRHALKSK